MALLGWNVSEYPGYLCDWFKDGNPFGYQSDRLQSACEALNSTSDLSTAQKDVYEIQSILAQDLPFIPLYSGITYDAYRNIKYPFDSCAGRFERNLRRAVFGNSCSINGNLCYNQPTIRKKELNRGKDR